MQICEWYRIVGIYNHDIAMMIDQTWSIRALVMYSFVYNLKQASSFNMINVFTISKKLQWNLII